VQVIKLNIDVPDSLKGIYKHLFQVFAFHFQVELEFSNQSDAFLVSPKSTAHIQLSEIALDALLLNDYQRLRSLFDKSASFQNGQGTTDLVTSALYMLNYLQEYEVDETDDLGRFQFKNSYQAALKVTDQDLVSPLFDSIAALLKVVKSTQAEASRVFVSHDIDDVNAGFLEDGFYALKKGRIDILLRLIFNHLMGNPQWLNMSQIMDVNDEYDIKSTFFWLVDQHRIKSGKFKLRNADYSLSSNGLKRALNEIDKRQFEHGLHKGISSDSFMHELSQFPRKVIANRNHFLKLSLPKHFELLEETDLKLDLSLGFAEQYGFRNSYAKPIHPFCMTQSKATKALYVPLVIMDTTNWIYKKTSTSQMTNEMTDLLEKHKTDALISLLWHNKYFSELKFDGYLSAYKTLLDYCKSSSITGITQGQILEAYNYKHS
jgi:hypothetical protein